MRINVSGATHPTGPRIQSKNNSPGVYSAMKSRTVGGGVYSMALLMVDGYCRRRERGLGGLGRVHIDIDMERLLPSALVCSRLLLR